ncbi:family 16 glycoside hydrolase [Terriglobus aquaticus]|uniref:Family 16 glycoside hydrolase n=1 Tax=Terriglobus aquaticus TaxID=940139 RepID=A0ABW9KFN2_9BACT|nr:family 16 glycoside hydrolase [Terriglobus aquaticus]
MLLALGLASGALAQAPLSLFNGTSLLGWNNQGPWSASGGALTTSGSGNRRLLTAVPFGDFNLEFEYTETGSPGAQFRMWTTKEGTGGLTVDLDFSGSKNGVGGIQSLGRSSLATISGGWHRVQVEASHGRVTVRVDGQPAGSTSTDLGARAGYLGFEANGEGQFTVRSPRLRPLNLNSTFNGTDLGGWKSVPRPADAKGGFGHSAAKVFSFGAAGGDVKPHDAKWTVKGGAIHGESGPGGLENGTPLEDGVIQIAAAVHGDLKPDNLTALSVRNPSGQFGTGYRVGIGPYAGTVQPLNKGGMGKASTPVDETVAFGGRVIETWINGNISSVLTDPRPESGSAQSGARTQGGTVMLVLPNSGPSVDVSRVNLIALGKPYGAQPRSPAPQPVPTTAAIPTVPPVANSGDSAAADALKRAADDQARKEADDQRKKDQVASLMTQALGSSDPAEQKDLYQQVMRLDPANPNAMAGFKEAQGKLQEKANADAQAAKGEQAQKSNEDQTNMALVKAQSAFLGGHLSDASNSLSIAERLSPGNPVVRELRSRINAATAQRSRLIMLGSGAGIVSLLAAISLWWRRRRLQRFPVLEVTSGIDAGRSYRIEKDQTRVGAVPQDGGQKNDIVVRDVEHAISRFHCEIVRRNGQLYVQDLNSSNGTRVDGERLKPGSAALLRRGTRIELAGTVELRFGYDKGTKKA